MVFSSISFIFFFLPIFLIAYELVRSIQGKNILILIFSVFYYAWGAPDFVIILLLASLVNFQLVARIQKSVDSRLRKRLLFLSIGLSLGLLAYFKYANFFVENCNVALDKLGYENVRWTEIVLPIGISFYTFQAITYTVDVYRSTHSALKRFDHYLLYILLFPQMIAGPIVQYHQIAGQIGNRDNTYEKKLRGFIRFCIGLAKKVLIANVLGEVVTEVMDMESFSSLNSTDAWLVLLAFSFQIYFDFSGYSDMAIGLGLIMGFKIPENFDNPYQSISVTNFWRRWHMTLGAFMRDYLYIPLGGNKGTKMRLYLNLWIVFLLSGLWHGDSWNFVIWGIYHGCWLVLDRLFLERILIKSGKFISIPFTFLIVLIGWVWFSTETLEEANSLFSLLFAFDFSATSLFISSEFIFTIIVAAFFSLFTLLPLGMKIQDDLLYKDYPTKRQWRIYGLGFILFMLSVGYISSNGFNPFIYYAF